MEKCCSDSIGAVWALTKNGGSWGQTAFQNDEENMRWSWEVVIVSGETIVVGVPYYEDHSWLQMSGRGVAVVFWQKIAVDIGIQ